MAQSTDYFESPEAGKKQYHGSFDGAIVEHGEFSFVTTGLTVELPTRMSKILSAQMAWQESTTVNEQLYCDLTVTSGAVTVTRELPSVSREFHFAIDDGQVASNDVSTTPLFIADAAMTLTKVEFYAGTGVGGGTWTLDVEKSGTANHFLAAGDLTEAGGAVDSFTSFSNTAIADGDIIQFNTNGGTTSGPGDVVISLHATLTTTATSAGTFNYTLFGLP